MMRPTAAAAPSCFRGRALRAEVARGLPTAVLAASAEETAAAAVQEHFRGPALRLYATDDVPGVEIGGALKNVIAIAAGVVEGLNLGHNALAALITRGLAEISRAGLRRRWAARNARGSQRSRRPGAHLHGGSEPESPGRHRARTRTIDHRYSVGHADGGRGRSHDGRGPGARRETWHRAADRRPHAGSPRRALLPGRSGGSVDAAPAARRS